MLKKIISILLIISGLSTFVVAVYYPVNATTVSFSLKMIFFLLLFTDAVCYFVATWGILKNKKWLFPWTVALLVINILGLIFDDIGAIDITYGIFNFLILVLVIYNHQKN